MTINFNDYFITNWNGCVHVSFIIGYSYGRVSAFGFSQGQGPILLGYLYCSGEEKSLIGCNQNYHRTHSTSICKQHSYDAVVICERK